MKIQTRITLLLLLSILVFAGASIGYQHIKNRQVNILIKANEESKNLAIENNLRFKSQIFLGPVSDYSCWDEMVNYINKPTQKWEDINLTTLHAFNVSLTWIFNKDFKLIYSAIDTTSFKEAIVIDKETIQYLFNENEDEFCHYFLNFRDTLFEITGATVVPSADIDHKMEHQGYFFLGKFWSKDYIKQMEDEMDFKISFRLPNDSINSNKINESKITITKTFKDAYGKKIMFVDFTTSNKILESLSSSNLFFYFLICMLIITSIILFIAIHYWVNNPIKIITNSLNGENESTSILLTKKNEFGEIARLIRNFFEQKKKLENEIEEREEAQKTIYLLYQDTVDLNEQLEANKEELKTSMEEIEASKEELSRILGITSEMNEELTKHQNEITDSISYASLIQSALLTPIESIKQLEREFFILYKPRNIVSGDFYWITQRGSNTIIVVADCTGHGVPGGFMSMLGMAYLTEIVNQNCDFTSGEILDQLRKRVIESLHQHGKSGESKDGMDIALCIVDFERMTLQFSGAYNPLYLVRDSINDEGIATSELLEFRGDRMPIGYSLKLETSFTTNEITLQKDDVIYMITDGFQDQISQSTRQKFKRSRLRDLLLENHKLDFEEQKNLLNKAFVDFSKDYPQIDDVLAFGMKI